MTMGLPYARVLAICLRVMRRVPGAFAFVVLLSGHAHATQAHGDPEGLYSHLIAHIFFICTMVILLVQIARNRPPQKGWKRIQTAALLFLLWNITTFSVHIIQETLPPGTFSRAGGHWSTAIDLSSTGAMVFYLGKIFDHVFMVGAVLVFLLGVRAFRDDVPEDWREEQE